jgi:RNA polymerase sigma-70 factor (ECF subfamily)
VQVLNSTGPLRPKEIEDIVLETINETVLRALRFEQRYDPARPAIPWLMAIATNVLLERRRANFRNQRQRPETDLGDCWSVLENTLAAEEEADSSVDAGAVGGVLALLPEDTHRILRLRFAEGLDGPALAERLGISHGAARVRLHRALQLFRERWLAGKGQSDD